MASLLLTRPYILGAGIGLSLLLPLRAAPLQCQYTAPYSNPHAPPESGWSLAGSEAAAKQGRTSYAQERSSRPSTGLLNARCMRQISLGSVLGLATGLGLRVFSKALVFVLGVGIVVVEVCLPPPPTPPLVWCVYANCRSGRRPEGIR
jgi:hypothetical protein